MRNVLNYHHSYTFFLLLFVILVMCHPSFSININILSSTESLTISSNRTIVSPGDVFELGFFKPATSSRWYLGIWYKTMPEGTYVWVANRGNPLSSSIGTLKIVGSNLVLLADSDIPIWSTNLTGGDVRSTVVAELLANGNLVLRHSNKNKSGEFLWQSFDFPTDTLLPEMKLGWDRKTGFNRFLRSWKSPDDPSEGNFLYKLETRGSSEFYILKEGEQMYRSGPWDGIRFNGMPEMQKLSFMGYNFTENQEEVTYTFLMTNHSIYSRLTLTPSGSLQQFTWIPTERENDLFWNSPKDQCDAYEKCGPYSYCNMFTSSMCNCIKGFEPKNPQEALTDGLDGCVRKTKLSCTGDGFWKLSKVKLPDTKSVIVDKKIDAEECEMRCLQNCNCTAFANKDIRNGGSGCVIWTGELVDMRTYSTAGQDLYVRLAAADLGDESNINGKSKSNLNGKIIGLVVGVCVVLLLSFTMFCFWQRKQKQARKIAAPIGYQERNKDLVINGIIMSSRRHFTEEFYTEDLELPLMEFEAVVIATNNFSDSNKLGQGGFGIVYKGTLLDGREIAVKRLSKMSLQGITEFKNEVKLIARLQHINLVRLIGCCVDMDEKILIYEYLENRDLDSHIFDKTESHKLNWQKRFDITNGIARGLLYLHQDSRFRIIHRDLKASNVLLDKDMTPKISDFGMARIFGRDETEVNTMKVVGTYGYMSPEYAMDGIYSIKSDVFSFGVLLLEIVSGKKNRGFYNSDHDNNLLGYTWRNWKEGKGLEIVDPVMIDVSSSLSPPPSSFRPHEVLRCIQIGLLCVQERAQDRPTMLSVVSMLGSETFVIPQPKPPGYCVGRSPLDTDPSSSEQTDEESWTINQVTISVIDPR